jgi:4-alpha-glucanotransferase
MDRIYADAAQWGIETQYRDAYGHMRAVGSDTLKRLAGMLAGDREPAPRLVAQTVVLRRGREKPLPVNAPPNARIRWEIVAEERLAQGEAVASDVTLPHDLPLGTYRLRLTAALPDGERQEQATLLVAPQCAYQGSADAPRRMWGLTVQLYGVRSRRNWGHGDFTDLAGLIDLAAAHGAAAIGLNPLHAHFEDRPEDTSPYSPNSRLFLNALYIDVEAVPEFPGLAAAGLTQEVERLRYTELVDYQGVAVAKMHGLRLAFENFRNGADPQRRAAFEDFRRERTPVLTDFACFETLRRRYRRPWWEWPAEWQNPGAEALSHLSGAGRDEVAFHEFVQWIAHEQLDACRAKVCERGLPIGLYLDIAVGARPEGFDAWSERESILHDAYVGAPPDALNTEGQNWGLAGINPIALERQRFAPFRRMLRAAMRYAGAVRLDHVLGLRRVFLIPKGMRAIEGSYVNFPFAALLAVAAQESVQNRCIVIGEDLGTVPENFRETLMDWGVWSYQVTMFERDHAGAFRPPETYRENALVTFTTHDLPTFAGWSSHYDIALKRRLGLDPGESDEQRERARAALAAAIGLGGGARPDFTAVARYLARAPSRLLVIPMEDVLGVVDQPNIPGTLGEHPNWRRRLPVCLEDLKENKSLAAVADIMTSAGRSAWPRK